MSTYELMVVFTASAGDVTDEKTAAVAVKQIIGAGVTVDSVQYMGKKSLAYPIKHATEGVYVLANLTGSGMMASEIEKRVQMRADIMRYLVTVKS